MTKFRRLGLIKPKREKTEKVKKADKFAQLKLMGLSHRNQATTEGEVKEVKESGQMKLNTLAVQILGVKQGDRVDILNGIEENTFMIAKVSGDKEGRVLSANKGTEALSVTFTEAHKLLKTVGTTFEVTTEVITAGSISADSEEERNEINEIFGSYSWFVIRPVAEESKEDEKEVEKPVESVGTFS